MTLPAGRAPLLFNLAMVAMIAAARGVDVELGPMPPREPYRPPPPGPLPILFGGRDYVTPPPRGPSREELLAEEKRNRKALKRKIQAAAAQRRRTPWEFSDGPAPGEGVPNTPSAEGAALGAQMARLCDIEEHRQRERFPDHHPRCDDCAFRLGTVPNQCTETQMDALKAVLEGIPFYCHKGLKDDGSAPKRLCAGWVFLAGSDVVSVERLREKVAR